MRGRKTNRCGRLMTAIIIGLVFSIFFFQANVRAEEGILGNSTWERVFTITPNTGGIIQSVCITENYLITIENAGDNPELSDTVSAYYINDFDENGNPVERFSLAKQNTSDEWEHCNGMCYNPVTREIYVTLYTNTIPENRGCLYVMDPLTLEKKGRIKVTDDFNLLAIAYDNAADRYFIQTNAEAEYSVMILDANFRIVDDFGPEDPSPGYNFQDWCLAEGHLLEFPLTWNMNIGEYMMAYNIESRSVVDTIELHFSDIGEYQAIEPEDIARLNDREFLAAVNVLRNDSSRECIMYRAVFPNLTPLTEETPEITPEPQDVDVVEETALDEQPGPDVNVVMGSQELVDTTPLPKEKKKAPVGWILLLVFLLAGGAAFALYVRHVRIEREKREARMRRARRIVMAKMSRDDDEPFDLSELDRIKKEFEEERAVRERRTAGRSAGRQKNGRKYF